MMMREKMGRHVSKRDYQREYERRKEWAMRELDAYWPDEREQKTEKKEQMQKIY
jgi:hypothetical protein